jgi:hypothetical protein
MSEYKKQLIYLQIRKEKLYLSFYENSIVEGKKDAEVVCDSLRKRIYNREIPMFKEQIALTRSRIKELEKKYQEFIKEEPQSA